MLNAHISPEQNLAMIRAQGFVNLAEVIDVDLTIARRFDVLLGASLAQFLGFIGADVEEGTGESGRQICEHPANKSEGSGGGWREHIAVGHFRQIGKALVL